MRFIHVIRAYSDYAKLRSLGCKVEIVQIPEQILGTVAAGGKVHGIPVAEVFLPDRLIIRSFHVVHYGIPEEYDIIFILLEKFCLRSVTFLFRSFCRNNCRVGLLFRSLEASDGDFNTVATAYQHCVAVPAFPGLVIQECGLSLPFRHPLVEYHDQVMTFRIIWRQSLRKSRTLCFLSESDWIDHDHVFGQILPILDVQGQLAGPLPFSFKRDRALGMGNCSRAESGENCKCQCFVHHICVVFLEIQRHLHGGGKR